MINAKIIIILFTQFNIILHIYIMTKYNYVFFFSEGPPNDKGLVLGDCKDKLIEAAKPHVDNISYYTPKILEDMGYGEYVKNYEDKGLCIRNPGMNHIGFEAWKPLILLLELEKMEYGDILIYRDSNIITKSHNSGRGRFENIKNDVKECLDIYKFDFCIPSQNSGYLAHPYIKTNVIKELGENHPMMWKVLLLSCHQFFMRKSKCVLELLEEWRVACLNEEWRNGKVYGELHEGFKWSTNAQAILCCIITNWIRKRKYNIPLDYMKLYFPYGDLKQKKTVNNFPYLKYLNPLLESNGKIKGIYINLERDKNKKKLMEKNLDKLDFCNYRRFNAIVGSKVYNKLLKEDKIYKLNDKRGIYVNNFMVGCWQSHLHIWQEMINKNIPVQLIMEDDCVFHEKFNEKFYKVLDMIKDKEFDIFYIGYCGDAPIFNKELHILNHGTPKATHSYILTLNGAKKLVDRISRLNWPIDEIMGGMMYAKKLFGYKTSELLVWQPWQWDRTVKIKKKYFNI